MRSLNIHLFNLLKSELVLPGRLFLLLKQREEEKKLVSDEVHLSEICEDYFLLCVGADVGASPPPVAGI